MGKGVLVLEKVLVNGGSVLFFRSMRLLYFLLSSSLMYRLLLRLISEYWFDSCSWLLSVRLVT